MQHLMSIPLTLMCRNHPAALLMIYLYMQCKATWPCPAARKVLSLGCSGPNLRFLLLCEALILAQHRPWRGVGHRWKKGLIAVVSAALGCAACSL